MLIIIESDVAHSIIGRVSSKIYKRTELTTKRDIVNLFLYFPRVFTGLIEGVKGSEDLPNSTTVKILKRANMIIEAVQTHKVIYDVSKIHKVSLCRDVSLTHMRTNFLFFCNFNKHLLIQFVLSMLLHE